MNKQYYIKKFGIEIRSRPFDVELCAVYKQYLIWLHTTPTGVKPYSKLEQHVLDYCQQKVSNYWKQQEDSLPSKSKSNFPDIKPNVNFYPNEINYFIDQNNQFEL